MAVSPTYPGVYIQEVPSGVRTIAGVPTAICAFIGRAARGAPDEPVTLHSFGDFEREFGGLGLAYPMGYAVRDFFRNGGGEAVVVRIYNPPSGDASASLDANGLDLEAASPGSWANGIRVRVDHDVPSDLPWLATFGLSGSDLFNLTVRDGSTGATETFMNLTVADSPRRVDRVLRDGSALVRVSGALPGSRPGPHDAPDPGDDIWADDDLSAPVGTTGNDSAALDQAAFEGSPAGKTGLHALEKTDLFNLLCIPPDTRGGTTPSAVYQTALAYCQSRRAMLLVDPPANWTTAAQARDGLGSDLGLSGTAARNAALYFPRVEQADPLLDGKPDTFVPCGVVAGIMARTDAQRGVWKAPAGLDADLRGVQALATKLTDAENGILNPLGINVLRSFPVRGRVVWGARTLRGADQLADEYKYIPVRRLALFIEESLFRGTQWVVFEPNDEPLWAQIRLNIGAFMHNLFRQGAFQGSSPTDAYFVKCDAETTTQNDINLGIVNVVVGFAPLKPAEFVIIKIQQIAGQIDT
jgi:uncharacterized protein